jgi:hypothetical protein
MNALVINVDGADVRLSRAELVLLVNALNEACHGVRELSDDGEFQTRLGAERSDAKALLSALSAIIPNLN